MKQIKFYLLGHAVMMDNVATRVLTNHIPVIVYYNWTWKLMKFVGLLPRKAWGVA